MKFKIKGSKWSGGFYVRSKIWRQIHSQKLSKDCQKGKRKCNFSLFPEVESAPDFVGGDVQRDNLANITTGCLRFLSPTDPFVVDWLGDLHITRLQLRHWSSIPYLTYSAVVPFAPVYIQKTQLMGHWGLYQKPWYRLSSDTGYLWSTLKSSVTFKDRLVWNSLSKQEGITLPIQMKFKQFYLK